MKNQHVKRLITGRLKESQEDGDQQCISIAKKKNYKALSKHKYTWKNKRNTAPITFTHMLTSYMQSKVKIKCIIDTMHAF